MIEKLGLKQPPNSTVRSMEEAVIAAEKIGFPLVVRPSYVLGGPRYGDCLQPGRIETLY